MKRSNIIYCAIILFASIVSLPSCSKQTSPLTSEQETQNAINKIREIIGSDVTIKILDSNASNIDNIKSESIGLAKSSVRKLSINEFRNVYNALKSKNIKFETVSEIRVDSTHKQSKIKSNSIILIGDDTYDVIGGDDGNLGPGGPRPAGLYTTTFKSEFLEYYLKGHVDGNDPLLLSNINVQYRSDVNGRILGSPLVYFSGLSIYNWSQFTSDLLSFNSQNFTSVYLVTGLTNFNISLGPIVLNITTSEKFRITICMDDDSLRIVKIELLESGNQSM